MREPPDWNRDVVETVGPGCLVLIVGPSGAGKDTLIAEARRDLADRADIHFATRVVTRPVHDTEHSIAASKAEFAAQRQAGAFALTWEAHGLSYGVPAEIDLILRKGETVVVNVSRTIIADVRQRYARSCVILIDASPVVRRQRLLARGRENKNAIPARLSREVPAGREMQSDVRILNDGSVEAGADELRTALIRLLHPSRPNAASRRSVAVE